jgi:predicted RNA-binding protein (virulence factor B family)
MAEIGKTSTLPVVKDLDFGVYLDAEGLGEILLPRRYVPDGCTVGDEVEVFLYRDSEDALLATTEVPLVEVGRAAFLKVVAVTKVGAFLDWGLPKDLLVPFREQTQEMEAGRSYVVFVYLDRKSRRIAASTRLDRYLAAGSRDFEEGQRVDLLIYGRTDLGYKAIVDDTCWGVLYDNEVFQPLRKGQRVEGYIKQVRSDAKLDLTLHKPGYEKVDDLSTQILERLKAEGGFLPVSDKSPPEQIYARFEVSKKTFKKAVGALYRARLITRDPDGIRLVEPGPVDG